ncbi:MAG: hypothetical protein ACTSQE_00185 [Candidatus Heimdallarchaeaceae archaeon]
MAEIPKKLFLDIQLKDEKQNANEKVDLMKEFQKENSEFTKIVIYRCKKCGNNYYSHPTRCKNIFCNSISFKQIETDYSEKLKIYSGF